MSIFDSIRLSCQAARLRANVQLSDNAGPRFRELVKDEASYKTALRRGNLPRLPLSFTSLLHEINFVCIIGLLERNDLQHAYAVASDASESTSYGDVILRGVMSCYISSSEDSWTSLKNLLSAKGMAMSDDKVAEMFNLPLSTMQEKDHPTLPGVRIGERSEGRHSGLVKEISKILRDTSRKLVEAGFTSLGEVVERAFADVKARPEVEPQEHMAISLLAVAPSLGEVFKVQGAEVNLHGPLLWLLQNLLTLLERSDSSAVREALPLAPQLPANCSYTAGLAAIRLGLLRCDSAPSDDVAIREIKTAVESSAGGLNSRLSLEAQQLLRACAVDLCEHVVNGIVRQQPAPEGWMKAITPSGIEACLEFLYASAS